MALLRASLCSLVARRFLTLAPTPQDMTVERFRQVEQAWDTLPSADLAEPRRQIVADNACHGRAAWRAQRALLRERALLLLRRALRHDS